MTSWLRTRLQHMNLGDFLPLGLFMACVAIALGYFAFLNANPHQSFWFVPSLPVPPYATHVEHYSGSLPGSRTIRFETDQPAEKIRRFYRAELPKPGWSLLCSATQLEQPGCPLVLSPNVELADAYTREHGPLQVRGVSIWIYKPGGYLTNIQHRVVEVIEYRYSISTP